MSELRERIAAILAKTHSGGETTFTGMADALIIELGLGLETRLMEDIRGKSFRQQRVATFWERSSDE